MRSSISQSTIVGFTLATVSSADEQFTGRARESHDDRAHHPQHPLLAHLKNPESAASRRFDERAVLHKFTPQGQGLDSKSASGVWVGVKTVGRAQGDNNPFNQHNRTMKQSISVAATLALSLSSISLAHNGAHDHGHEGDERAHLMKGVEEVSEVTDVLSLEVRDELTWLPDAEEPYSGWAGRSYPTRHNHWPHGWHDHPKQTVLVKFKNGAPTECRWLTKHDELLRLQEVMTDSEEPEMTVGRFMEGLVADNRMWRPTGIQHGKSIQWIPNGKKVHEFNMVKGSFHGPYTCWSGGRVRDQGQYAMGKKDGVNVSFYNNGQKRSEELWDKGELVTVQVWKIDGEKCPETTLTDGTGTHVWYHYQRGEKWQEVNYVDGLKDGPEITYRGDGAKLWTVEPWVKGQRLGTRIHYEFDGSRMEVTLGGLQDGMRIHYNKDGSIREKFPTLADYQQHLTDETEKKYGK